MKHIISLVIALSFLSVAEARDTKHNYRYEEAMATDHAKKKIDSSIQFFFGSKTKTPAIEKNFGEFQSNKKTNAFNKTDKKACYWAFLSAMLSFQKTAKKLGGNAVVNIRSYYRRNLLDGPEIFECGAGGAIAGVTFKGDVVKLK